MTEAISKEGGAWSWLGAQDADILLCGHSHRHAMVSAIRQGLIEPSIKCAVLSQAWDGHKEVDEEYWNTAGKSAGAQPLVIVWKGNQHNDAFLLKPASGFRLADGLECMPGIEEGDPFVPVEMLHAYFASRSPELPSVLKRIAKSRRILFLGTPPPKPEQVIRKRFTDNPSGWAEVAARRGLDIAAAEISPLSLRVQLWSITQDFLADSAARAGAEFVPVPGRTRDNEGALREELCTPDATHANARYGAIMWNEIYAKLRSARGNRG